MQLEALTRQLQAQREESNRLAVSAERGKIARDLHDSLMQALHVVVVHAEAAEEALERSPERTRESLHRIQSVGRDSLAETRQVLGMLRSSHGHSGVVAPRLSDLDGLLDSVRAAGVGVTIRIEGSARPLPASVNMSAYRIVQESLTNVLKHANAREARVLLRYDDDGLDVEIVDDGRVAQPVHGPDGELGGYGLLGMRERTALLGGTLSAAPSGEGGFAVRARLPLEQADR